MLTKTCIEKDVKMRGKGNRLVGEVGVRRRNVCKGRSIEEDGQWAEFHIGIRPRLPSRLSFSSQSQKPPLNCQLEAANVRLMLRTRYNPWLLIN